MRVRFGLLAALSAAATLLVAGPAPAAPAVGPLLRLTALSNTTAAPGAVHTFYLQITNVGDAAADATAPGEEIHLTATLPAGLSLALPVEGGPNSGAFDCSASTASVLDCTNSAEAIGAAAEVSSSDSFRKVVVKANVDPGASGTLRTDFHLSGGGAPARTSADPLFVTPDPPSFGVDAFDSEVADAVGNPFFQASGHPAVVSTSIDFNTTNNPSPFIGDLWPVAPTKDALVDLPSGFLGNPNGFAQCTAELLASSKGNIIPAPFCPEESQVGAVNVYVNAQSQSVVLGPTPVFNLVPPPGTPARFGFNLAGTVVVLDARVRSGGDYGISVSSRDIPEGLAVAGSNVTFWGVPSNPSHDSERACPGEVGPGFGGPTCPSTAPPVPFLRNPTACPAPGEGLETRLRIDSWAEPGVFDESAFISHDLPGYPFPRDQWGPERGTEGCDQVHFHPQIEAVPTTEAADSPSGLDFHLRVPQDCWAHAEETCQSDLKDARVTLPAGMSLNPSAASGLGSCSEAQIGYEGFNSEGGYHEFSPDPAACPDDSKIGEVTIDTPLLEKPLTGAVYLAKQTENPFDSLLAMYIVAEGSGVVVKQAGQIETGPSGRLTTVFTGAPQTPFSDLHLQLYGGPRAALRTPPTCGSYGIAATLTPWSGNATVNEAAAFEIDKCPNSGLDPTLHAGTANPLAGKASPFSLRLTREDGTEELAGIRLALPKGLLAYLKGIPYCSDAALATVSGALGTGAAQIASPACPAASQVGKVTVGAGAGPTPFYSQTGKAYWAGPYKGAPVSLAVVVPATAGPFDLGSVVVRNRFEVNPETAEITAISDPLPSSLHGIGLDLRDIRVDLDRPDYVLNPTSCDPMAFLGTFSGLAGSSAQRTERFQAAGCDRLGFKPKLSLKLKGATKRAGHPALKATLTMPAGGANIARASVALPHSAFLDQAHIGTVCTRVQFAADQCPARSAYGRARAYSPILDYYLQGPVYLRSSVHKLPDLVIALKGPASQPIEVDAVGRIDSVNGGIRTSFETVPDAPVSKLVLEMQGGSKGLIQNSTDLCRSTNRASAKFDAQNGKFSDFAPLLKPDCGTKRKKSNPYKRS